MQKHLALILFMTTALLVSGQGVVLRYLPAAAVPNNGQRNLQNLLAGYLAPIAEDFGMTVNNGWFTTPVSNKQWGFDINLTATTVRVGSQVKTFELPPLEGITYTGSGPLPSAYGAVRSYPAFRFIAGPNSNLEFQGPDGAGIGSGVPFGALAIPTLQVGLGVLRGTDLRIRYSPRLEFNGVAIENWGGGILHDFKHLIPAFVNKQISLSVFAGYTRLTATTHLSGVYSGSGQEGVASSVGITGQIVIGKEFLKWLTLYVGGGYNQANTSYEIQGTYLVDKTDNGTPLTNAVTLVNPFKNDFSKSSARFTSGVRMRAGPITLNADYSLISARSLLTAGIGLAFRGKE